MSLPPLWLKYLPGSFRAKIEHRFNLVKAISNTGWLFADRILRMGVGLFVGVWMARYLGAEQFGLLNYAMAFVVLFSAVATMGLNGIVVRDLVEEPETSNSILGSAFFLQILGGLIALALAVFAINIARPGDNLAKVMVMVLGFVMVIKSTEVVKYWFESQVQSKYTVWIENGAFLVFAAGKVGLILLNASLMAFVWAILIEGVVVAAGLLIVYTWQGGKLNAWRPGYQRARKLLLDSWPLILSGIAIVVYMRIDQIMLGQMLGDNAVGNYSAAVRISEVFYFIPVSIVASVFPSIVAAKKQSEILYKQRLQKLYDLMVALSIIVAIPITIFADEIIAISFGDEYLTASTVLSIHIWSGLFTSLGVASSKWFLIENHNRALFYRTVLGAIVNIILNLWLIPISGMIGAAIATLVSYSVAALWFDMIYKKTRQTFLMKLRALLMRSLYVR